MLDFVKMFEREKEMAGVRNTNYKPAASKKIDSGESNAAI
jgi:hypothetical protein